MTIPQQITYQVETMMQIFGNISPGVTTVSHLDLQFCSEQLPDTLTLVSGGLLDLFGTISAVPVEYIHGEELSPDLSAMHPNLASSKSEIMSFRRNLQRSVDISLLPF
jgi:hypothetical protein